MNKLLKTNLVNTLKSEAENLLQSDGEIHDKIKIMQDIDNMMKIIDNYDDLEPTLKRYFKEKHDKEKWQR